MRGSLSNGATRTSRETGKMLYLIRNTNRICEQIITNAVVVHDLNFPCLSSIFL